MDLGFRVICMADAARLKKRGSHTRGRLGGRHCRAGRTKDCAHWRNAGLSACTFFTYRRPTSMVYRRKLNLKANFEGDSSYYSFKRFVLGAFDVGLIGSTCIALPWGSRSTWR
jgi:hypothetical protein